ncbi:MAG: hypothetical protein RLZZ347_466 [Candidatus Parcubacteria bacterium]|jgi:phosphoglycerate dehydrogenase-like enzyme
MKYDSLSALSVLSRAKPKDVVLRPFPYLILKNAVDDSIADELIRQYPPLVTTTKKANQGSNERHSLTAVDALKDETISPLWKDFIRANISPDFVKSIFSLFKKSILQEYPDFEKEFGPIQNLRVGLRHKDTFETADVLIDSQISVNTPVFKPSSVRGGHLDNPDKIFFGLFYLRHPDDKSVGGELELYKHIGEDYYYDRSKNIDRRFLEHVATVPYQKNSLVMVLNTKEAVHGVSVRSSTDVPRYFLNLLIEVKKPLYQIKFQKRLPAFLQRYGLMKGLKENKETLTPYALKHFNPQNKSVLLLNAPRLERAFPKISATHNLIYLKDIPNLSESIKKDITVILIGKGHEKVTTELLQTLPSVKVVGIATGSLEKFNTEVFAERNITVLTSSEVYADAVAEFTLMDALVGIRNAGISYYTMKHGGWGLIRKSLYVRTKDFVLRVSTKVFGNSIVTKAIFAVLRSGESTVEKFFPVIVKNRLGSLMGEYNQVKSERNASKRTLMGATVGIVGFGPVARKFIALLKPFNVSIKIYSEYLSDAEASALGVKKVSLQEVCKSDVVSIHRGLSARTKKSFGKNEIDLLPQGCVLVNTSRGEIIDQEALIERLKERDMVACLDVFDGEPLAKNSVLRKLPNVFLTSHIANSTDLTYASSVVILAEQALEMSRR